MVVVFVFYQTIIIAQSKIIIGSIVYLIGLNSLKCAFESIQTKKRVKLSSFVNNTKDINSVHLHISLDCCKYKPKIILNLMLKRCRNCIHQALSFNFLSHCLFSSIPDYKPNSHNAKQHLDSEHILKQKVDSLASLISKSKYPIFFTGAGISTSLGIPDYRSGQNTIIKTGPGMWNRSQEDVKRIQQSRNKLIDQLIPSPTHMAIYTLLQQSVFKHVVSQNTDGLHLRSGIKKNNLSELHGNRNLQFCTQCQRKYLRDFRTLRKQDKHFKPGQKRDHFTGRKCQNCNGQLHDSIIYFGEKLPKSELLKSYEQGAKSDLCLAIGSSLTVKPSSNIPLLPLQYQKQGKLVILNIQETMHDPSATLKISGFCDQVMSRLIDKMGLKIMPYRVQRYIEIYVSKQYFGWNVKLNGLDQHHAIFSFIRDIQLMSSNHNMQAEQTQKETQIQQLKSKFSFDVPSFEHQNLKHIDFCIKFFGPFPDFKLNLFELINQTDIIGHEVATIKIVSQNNGQWKVERVMH